MSEEMSRDELRRAAENNTAMWHNPRMLCAAILRLLDDHAALQARHERALDLCRLIEAEGGHGQRVHEMARALLSEPAPASGDGAPLHWGAATMGQDHFAAPAPASGGVPPIGADPTPDPTLTAAAAPAPASDEPPFVPSQALLNTGAYGGPARIVDAPASDDRTAMRMDALSSQYRRHSEHHSSRLDPEIAALRGRVTALEHDLAHEVGNIQTIEGIYAGLAGRLTVMERRIGSLEDCRGIAKNPIEADARARRGQ